MAAGSTFATCNLLSKLVRNMLAKSQNWKEKFFMHLLKMAVGKPSTTCTFFKNASAHNLFQATLLFCFIDVNHFLQS